MIKGAKDKMQREVESKGEREYFFPEHSITITAATAEEAQEKLFTELKNKNKII